jgi:hypothetical protein
MDSIIRIVGAISLWSVEIIMQLRVYALFKCSRKVERTVEYSLHALILLSQQVAAVNAFLFLASIAGFFYVLIYNAMRRRAAIADVIHLPLPGCPSIRSGIEWAQWIPGWLLEFSPISCGSFNLTATAYEGVLFGFALYKTLGSTALRMKEGRTVSLYSLIIRDNLLYFFGFVNLFPLPYPG